MPSPHFPNVPISFVYLLRLYINCSFFLAELLYTRYFFSISASLEIYISSLSKLFTFRLFVGLEALNSPKKSTVISRNLEYSH